MRTRSWNFWILLFLLLPVASAPSATPRAAAGQVEDITTEPYGNLQEVFEETYNIRLLKSMESARIMRTAPAMAISASNWPKYFVDTLMGWPVGESISLTDSDVETLRLLLTTPENYVKVLEAVSCASRPDVAIVASGSVGTIQILMDLECLTVLQFRGELGDTQSLVAIPMGEALLALAKTYFPDVDE